jgi:HPt (histidine-containing phosphotransfer) domain-containing protein
MPSSPPVSADCPVDLDHLKRMTSGEQGLEREVLQLFLKQTSRLVAALESLPAETGALSHTLKGSARAIGAFRLADSAAALEEAACQGRDSSAELAAVHVAVAEARAKKAANTAFSRARHRA